ncbi:MAG: CopG family ribbon-helix-helix protein [Anaerolineales bacterium]
MPTAKIAITIDKDLLTRLDHLVVERQFPSRSRAIQEAVAEKLARMKHTRLAIEAAKLDPGLEQELADEGLEEDFSEWPAY